MDDNSFDKIIREKAEGFQDSGQDPQALADMRKRLSQMPSGANGRNWTKPAAIAAAMLLFTLVNFGVVWYFSKGQNQQLMSEVGELKSERHRLLAMQEDLMKLKANPNQVDTVYIFRDVITPASANNNPGISQNTASGLATAGSYLNAVVLQSRQLNSQYRALKADEELSEELATFLSDQGLLLIDNEGERILIVMNQEVTPINMHRGGSKYVMASPSLPHTLPRVWDLSDLAHASTNKQRTDKKLSNKTLWALEKHQHAGVDFQFGLEVMTTRAIPGLGIGDYNASLGVLTEVIFSPNLRLETGLHYGRRSYAVKEQEILQLTTAELNSFPGYDDQTPGDLVQVESESEIIKMPINLKLMGVLDRNKRWYVSAGVSPQWHLEQEFDFQYAIDGPSEPSGSLDEFRSFIGTRQDETPGFQVGTLNLGIGTEVYVSESTRWQIGAYYERGLGDLGSENMKIQGVGLKTSLWFNKP